MLESDPLVKIFESYVFSVIYLFRSHMHGMTLEEVSLMGSALVLKYVDSCTYLVFGDIPA